MNDIKNWLLGILGMGEYFLPVWVQILIGVAAAIVAAGIIWKKLIRPIHELIKLLDGALPLLRDMVKHFNCRPNAFAQIDSILEQFGTDSGTTLRDSVDRLEAAAKKNAATSDVLETNAETARKLAEQDRRRMAELTELVNIIRAKQRENIETVDRLEAGDKIVASELAASHKRAGNVDGDPGAAADAAVQKDKQ